MSVPGTASVRQLILSDQFRHVGRMDLISGVKLYARSAPFRYQFWLRARGSRNPAVRIASKVMLRGMASRHGVEIPTSVYVGPGLLITHLRSIVVNSTAYIGNNCTINHGTTIGSTRQRAANIGDDVYIGPHCCIVEDVTIGDGATIGAGSVVVKDVAAGTTVAGNPAKVISTKTPGRLIKNRWVSADRSAVSQLSDVSPKKLLFVIPALSDGGAQKQCIYLLNELQRRPEWELHLVRFHTGVHDDQLKRDRMTIHEIPVSSNYDVRALGKLIALARRIRPDIIMSWLLAADIYSYFVRLAVPGLRWLMTERNSRYPDEMRFRLRRLVGRRADAIVANSEAGEAYWQAVGSRAQRYVVGNILRPVAQRMTGANPLRRGLYVGRLEPQKNVVPLARAACAVAMEIADFEFVFVGEGTERKAMEDVIAGAGVGDRVRLLGFQQDVDAQLVAADVMVSLSKHEGMPNAMMESIAAGLPIVASAIPEHMALLGADYPYYVSDPEMVEETALAIRRALDDPAAVSHLSYARSMMAQMTPVAITDRYVSIFRQMLGTAESASVTIAEAQPG